MFNCGAKLGEKKFITSIRSRVGGFPVETFLDALDADGHTGSNWQHWPLAV